MSSSLSIFVFLAVLASACCTTLAPSSTQRPPTSQDLEQFCNRKQYAWGKFQRLFFEPPASANLHLSVHGMEFTGTLMSETAAAEPKYRVTLPTKTTLSSLGTVPVNVTTQWVHYINHTGTPLYVAFGAPKDESEESGALRSLDRGGSGDLTTLTIVNQDTQPPTISARNVPYGRMFHVAVLDSSPTVKTFTGYVFFWLKGHVAVIDACTLFSAGAKCYKAGHEPSKEDIDSTRLSYINRLSKDTLLDGYGSTGVYILVFEVDPANPNQQQNAVHKIRARPIIKDMLPDGKVAPDTETNVKVADGKALLFSRAPPTGFVHQNRVYLFEPGTFLVYSWDFVHLPELNLADKAAAEGAQGVLFDVHQHKEEDYFGCVNTPIQAPPEDGSSQNAGDDSDTSTTEEDNLLTTLAYVAAAVLGVGLLVVLLLVLCKKAQTKRSRAQALKALKTTNKGGRGGRSGASASKSQAKKKKQRSKSGSSLSSQKSSALGSAMSSQQKSVTTRSKLDSSSSSGGGSKSNEG